LEDLITGDYTPYVLADLYREVTQRTSVPTHTGEQIYLRQNFKDLIGLAALVQVSATLPQNYIAFEYPTGSPDW
jgi:L-alanine-DL-glutamate epimerase-like enolase superfamily enzyme